MYMVHDMTLAWLGMKVEVIVPGQSAPSSFRHRRAQTAALRLDVNAAGPAFVAQNDRWPSVSYRRCEGLELIANGDHVSADCPQF